jgi:hypothetical protein
METNEHGKVEVELVHTSEVEQALAGLGESKGHFNLSKGSLAALVTDVLKFDEQQLKQFQDRVREMENELAERNEDMSRIEKAKEECDLQTAKATRYREALEKMKKYDLMVMAKSHKKMAGFSGSICKLFPPRASKPDLIRGLTFYKHQEYSATVKFAFRKDGPPGWTQDPKHNHDGKKIYTTWTSPPLGTPPTIMKAQSKLQAWRMHDEHFGSGVEGYVACAKSANCDKPNHHHGKCNRKHRKRTMSEQGRRQLKRTNVSVARPRTRRFTPVD